MWRAHSLPSLQVSVLASPTEPHGDSCLVNVENVIPWGSVSLGVKDQFCF